MPNGIGALVPRGETEHTTTNWETQIKIPLGRVMWMVLLSWLGIVCVYVSWWALWLFFYDGPFLRWYRYSFWSRDLAPCWVYLWLRMLGKFGPLLALPFPAAAVFWFWKLIRHSFLPKVYNENWPPPWGQADPLETGAVTWENMDDRMYWDEEPEPQEPQERWLNVKTEHNGHEPGVPDVTYGRIPEPIRDVNDGLAGLCRGILNDTATLSWDGAVGKHGVKDFGYRQSVFRNELRQALEANHYGKRKGNEGFDWKPAGYAWMAHLVEHDLGIEYVPEAYLKYLPSGRSVGSSVGENGGNGGNGHKNGE